jgi:phosphoribosyl-dephospho-CoA transferase
MQSLEVWQAMDDTLTGSHGPIARHDFIWVNRHSRGHVADRIGDPHLCAVVRAWLTAARPLIVRQQPGPLSAKAERLAAGLPLPPSLGKRRIALNINAREVNRVAPPPALASVIASLPAAWKAPTAQLCHAGADIGIEFQVFGSAAWQALTALPYLTATSDLDLLWRPSHRSQLEDGMRLVQTWERTTGVRADGEIVFGQDFAVAWREWLRRDEQKHVLVKQTLGPSLRKSCDLLALLDDPAPASVSWA